MSGSLHRDRTAVYRPRVLLHLCALVICFAPAAVSPAQPHAAQNAVAPIVSALQARDFDKALKLSQVALAAHPADYRLWTLRGMATAGKGNLPQALTAYRHALRLAPAFLPALEGAAQTEFQLGQSDAHDTLQKILALRPEDPPTHALLGILDARAKNCANALGHFEKARPVLAQQPEAQADDALCLAEQGRDAEAVDAFSAILARDPSQRDARYNLALAQWNTHRAQDALDTLKPITDADAADPDVLILAADIVESMGDTARAVALLRKALVADPKRVDAYLQFATLSYDHASPQVGVDMINFGLTQLPAEPRLYLVRGILLTQLGEFTRAADDFEKASQLDPRLKFLGEAEGLVASQQHHSAQALAQFRAAVREHPNEAYAHYLLAEALNGEGPQSGTPEYAEELDAAKAAVRLDPKLVAARDLLSGIYLERSMGAQSIAESRGALAIDPDDQQAVYHLIVALRNTDQKDQIPALLKRLLALRAAPQEQGHKASRYRLYEDQPHSGATTP